MKRSLAQRLKRSKRYGLAVAGLFIILLVAYVGSHLRHNSSAATGTVVSETEQGVMDAPACSVPSAATSAGQTIQFGCDLQTSSGVLARRSQDFLDSLGVNIHMGSDRYSNFQGSEVLNDLTYVGIHNVRDNSGTNLAVAARQKLAAAGVKFDYPILHPNQSTPYSLAQNNAAVDSRMNDLVNNGLAASTMSIENWNEFDTPSVNNNDPNWGTLLQQGQPYLYQQTRARLGNGVQVLSPSLRGFSLDTFAKVLGDVSSNIDAGNMHTYFGGKTPESDLTDFSSFMQGSCSSAQSDTFDERIEAIADCISKSKDMVTTESGYHNDSTSKTGHLYTDEASTATYMPRMMLDAFRVGVKRTYIYELLDEPSAPGPNFEKHFGLFYGTATTSATDVTSAKPAATALHNLTTLLADSGSAPSTFTTGRLNYSLSGTTSGVHQVLFQKSTGNYWLALWRDDAVWDTSSFSDIPMTTSPITLNLPTAASVSLYHPNTDMTATVLPKAASQTFDLGPQVVLVKVQ